MECTNCDKIINLFEPSTIIRDKGGNPFCSKECKRKFQQINN